MSLIVGWLYYWGDPRARFDCTVKGGHDVIVTPQVSGDAAGGLHPCAPQQRLGSSLCRGHWLEQGCHLGGWETPSAGESSPSFLLSGPSWGKGTCNSLPGHRALCKIKILLAQKRLCRYMCACVYTQPSLNIDRVKNEGFLSSKMSTHSSKFYPS